jgi:hypothetical protein
MTADQAHLPIQHTWPIGRERLTLGRQRRVGAGPGAQNHG